jgi:ketosteroid isomerase-like protein
MFMKNKILIGGLLIVILSLLFACNQKKAEIKPDKDQVKAEIQAIENRFASTFNNRNADSLTYYADDAVSYFAGQEPIVGKAAIHQHIENELLDFPEGAKISFQTLEIYVTDDGNHVAEIGAHQLVDSTGKILQKGHYVSFFVKKDGKYYCMRDMANSVQENN